jgi:ABC-2 type transport system permease protein
MAEGIADLSYRHYSGELGKARGAWKVIAKVGILNALKNKWFWICTFLSAWYYIIFISFLYIMEQSLQAFGAGGSGGGNADMAQRIFDGIIWRDQFVVGFQMTHLLIVIITLIIGAGCIANDNRSNAMLVYLSRPCTKWVYLLGKWLGVFVPLMIAAGLPSLLFWAYGALNYQERGFLSDDPWMLVKLAVVFPIIAAFYTSLMVGISSLFRQPRMASAVFFGMYILTFFFSLLMRGFASGPRASALPEGVRRLAEEASYFSMSGVLQGFTKIVFDSNGGNAFGGRSPAIPKPELLLSLPPLILVIALGVLVAYSRVRAVEVVK